MHGIVIDIYIIGGDEEIVDKCSVLENLYRILLISILILIDI